AYRSWREDSRETGAKRFGAFSTLRAPNATRNWRPRACTDASFSGVRLSSAAFASPPTPSVLQGRFIHDQVEGASAARAKAAEDSRTPEKLAPRTGTKRVATASFS